MPIVYDVPEVLAFIREHMPFHAVEGMQAIGLKKDGQLIAGVIYEGFTKHNIWMHVAAVPGKRWLNRDYLRACFRYPFAQLGVKKVRGYVAASNAAARKFDEHLGFRQEAVLQDAATDGGDLILYVMDRSECRYV
jgi:RimJ/RimL family protein N-acetyltransferase